MVAGTSKLALAGPPNVGLMTLRLSAMVLVTLVDSIHIRTFDYLCRNDIDTRLFTVKFLKFLFTTSSFEGTTNG